MNRHRYTIFKIGYIILPFISFLFALKHYKAPWFKNALWLFIIFFGVSMSFTEGIDASFYRYLFDEAVSYKNINSFLDVFDSSITGQIDFARPLINFILTTFTNNYHILFGVYGLIFGFFFSRNIDFILKKIQSKNAELVIGLVVFLSFIIGFWNINGFRFWTAGHIFIYGLIHYIYHNRKTKGIIFAALSLTFHYSFILPFVLLLVYNYVPKFPKIYIVLILVLTLYNPLSDLSFVENFLREYAFNEQVENKIDVYTSDEAVIKSQEVSTRTNPIRLLSDLFTKGVILLLAWLLSSKLKNVSKKELKFYHFGLVLAFVSSILNFVPSVGSRFTIVGLFILLFASIIILLRHDVLLNRRKLLSKAGYLSSLLILVVNYWVLFTFSFHTVIGNYFTVFLDTDDVFYSVGNLLMDTLK